MYTANLRNRRCSISGCDDPADRRGFCAAHHLTRLERAADPAEAVALLERGTTLDDQPLRHSRLRNELIRLQGWWDRACEAAKFGRDFRVMPVEESRAAVDWCIKLAQHLLMADRGRVPATALEAARSEVWGRFRNLDRGLYSDGRPRTRPLL